MRLVLLVLLATSSAILSGNEFKPMDCTAVKQVYSRIQSTLKSNPMYQILKNRDRPICHREVEKLFYRKNCCDTEKEMALALTASSLFRKYIYTDCLQDFKYALQDIITYYKGEVSKVLDDRLVDHVMTYVENYDTDRDYVIELMKEQLRIYLEQKEGMKLPYISDKCFHNAKNFELAFRTHLDEYLSQLAALRDGIRLAINVLDALQDQKISPMCVEAITRSSVLTIGCNQCNDTTVGYKTCKTYCANVVNGCMKPLLTIIPVWKSWQRIMDSLDSNFTEEKEKLLEKDILKLLYGGFKADYHNLSERCDINRTQSTKHTTRRKIRKSERISENSSTFQSRHYYTIFNDMFNNIQFKFCRELDFASTADAGCWNGTHVGEYARNLTIFTKESQLNNPEVSDNGYIYYTAQQALADMKNFNFRLEPQLDGDGRPIATSAPEGSGNITVSIPPSFIGTHISTHNTGPEMTSSSWVVMTTVVMAFSVSWM